MRDKSDGMRHLPHLNYVRSFEAAARHLSFTSAAEELNYTQAAISNHVRALEDYIGKPLFYRYPSSLALTELGEAYLPAVREALGQIDIATEAIVSSSRNSKVVVSCPVSLALTWLPAQIRDFRAEHPHIELSIHGTVWTDVGNQVADLRIALEHRDEVPEGASRLWQEKLAVVCSPEFAAAQKSLQTPQDLLDADLIHILGRQVYWLEVARALDIPELNLDGGLKTDGSNVALELAAQGLGCAALPRALIGRYIENGQLIELFPADIDCPWSYHLTINQGPRRGPARLFANWLLEAARANPGTRF